MKTLFIGQNLIELKTIGSTNNYAKELIAKGEIIEGTLIVADNQQQGRGQRGTSWESEQGKNLTFSLILEPRFLLPQSQFMLSKSISLAVSKFIKSLTNADVTIKWPNDILVNGKKVAGILIENMVTSGAIQSSIIGIGINVNQERFENAPNATSIGSINNQKYDLKLLLNEVCGYIESEYLLLKNGSFETINQEYLNALFRYNVPELYIYKDRLIEAIITGINPDGKLILRRENIEEILCDFKEISFIL